MIEMNAEGFVINQSEFEPTSLGEVIDTLYRKLRTGKWMIMFFPLIGLHHVYATIEKTFFSPGTPKNAGFEMVPDLDDHTVIVMTYIPWMSQKQLADLMNSLTLEKSFPIEEDAVVMFFAVKDEPVQATIKRKDLFVHFRDYTNKQFTGT